MMSRNKFIRTTTGLGQFQGLRRVDEVYGLQSFAADCSRHARRRSSVARFRTIESGLSILKECIIKT